MHKSREVALQEYNNADVVDIIHDKHLFIPLIFFLGRNKVNIRFFTNNHSASQCLYWLNLEKIMKVYEYSEGKNKIQKFLYHFYLI